MVWATTQGRGTAVVEVVRCLGTWRTRAPGSRVVAPRTMWEVRHVRGGPWAPRTLLSFSESDLTERQASLFDDGKAGAS